jgi:catechol 2,3-dioxygenase-like lactoylglutathione lyase family enzyme
MRALHLRLRMTNLDRSLAFYRAVGFEVIAAGRPRAEVRCLGD